MSTELESGKGLLPFPLLFWIGWKLKAKSPAIAPYKMRFNPFIIAVLSTMVLSACYSQPNELAPVGLGAGSVASRTSSGQSKAVESPLVAPIQTIQFDREDFVPAKTQNEALDLCEKLAEKLSKDTGKTYINWNVKKGLKGGYYCQIKEANT